MNYVDMGRRIRMMRKQTGMTQEQFAKRVGISTSFMGHIERGTRIASLETLEGLVDALNSSMDYIARGHVSTMAMTSTNTTKRMRTLNELFRIILDNADRWLDDGG